LEGDGELGAAGGEERFKEVGEEPGEVEMKTPTSIEAGTVFNSLTHTVDSANGKLPEQFCVRSPIYVVVYPLWHQNLFIWNGTHVRSAPVTLCGEVIRKCKNEVSSDNSAFRTLQ
jgi:hypothetical protein